MFTFGSGLTVVGGEPSCSALCAASPFSLCYNTPGRSPHRKKEGYLSCGTNFPVGKGRLIFWHSFSDGIIFGQVITYGLLRYLDSSKSDMVDAP